MPVSAAVAVWLTVDSSCKINYCSSKVEAGLKGLGFYVAVLKLKRKLHHFFHGQKYSGILSQVRHQSSY